MRIRHLAGALLVAASAWPAAAQTVEGNLRFMTVIAEPIDLTLDGVGPVTIQGGRKYTLPISSGKHTVRFRTASEGPVEYELELAPEDVATAKDKAFWCVLLGRNASELAMRYVEKEMCQQLVDLDAKGY